MNKNRAPSMTGPNDAITPAVAASPGMQARIAPRPSEDSVEHDISPNLSLHESTQGTPQAVRQLLALVISTLGNHGLGLEDSLKVEVVLAEVMNNIVEHAYSEQAPGQLVLDVERKASRLAIRVEDDGAPMPSLKIPPGRPHDLSVDLQDLPEGGFGWFLIRELTEELLYLRDADRNCLTFTIELESRPL